MDHLDYITKDRKGKHLNYEERIKIEALLKTGLTSEEIGRQLGGRSGRTIRREIKKRSNNTARNKAGQCRTFKQ